MRETLLEDATISIPSQARRNGSGARRSKVESKSVALVNAEV